METVTFLIGFKGRNRLGLRPPGAESNTVLWLTRGTSSHSSCFFKKASFFIASSNRSKWKTKTNKAMKQFVWHLTNILTFTHRTRQLTHFSLENRMGTSVHPNYRAFFKLRFNSVDGDFSSTLCFQTTFLPKYGIFSFNVYLSANLDFATML